MQKSRKRRLRMAEKREMTEMPVEDREFYRKHYSDWTVHALPLVIYIPTTHNDRAEALALVREILDEAAFDIRVSEMNKTEKQH